MERLEHQVRLLFSIFLHAILLSCIMGLPQSEGAAATFGNGTDRLALLALKNGITSDPNNALSSWNNHSISASGKEVVILRLPGLQLVGTLSPSIGNLSFLMAINLSSNSFHGHIPAELGRLFRLQYLLLTDNSLEGEIPAYLTQCSRLLVLDLRENQLTGRIPAQVGRLSNLVKLDLGPNKLTGGIPPSVGNLSSLTVLYLGSNPLGGRIPQELGRLKNWQILQMSENGLMGAIALSLYNLSSMEFINMGLNHLQGTIPPHIGLSFPNLEEIYVGGNQFVGNIPASLSNISGLSFIEFSYNSFSGSVPASLGGLQAVQKLGFGANLLSGDLGFIASLTNCTSLETLSLGTYLFSGLLPHSIGNLSTGLNSLYLHDNQIHGSIPVGIENLANLTLLSFQGNLLTGSIPDGIGRLVNLEGLALFSNRLSEGRIPSSLGKYLEWLDVSVNKLDGSIPKQLVSVSSTLLFLNLSHKIFTGPLQMEVNGLSRQLETLDVSSNRLSGEILASIGNLPALRNLFMAGNSFQGVIPQSFSGFKSNQAIDLSSNNLSGEIPKQLGKLPFLRYLNLSFNDLKGEVPSPGIFQNMTKISIIGNQKLCGGAMKLRLPPCPKHGSKKQLHLQHFRLKIGAAAAAVSLVLLVCIFAGIYRRKMLSSRKMSASLSLEDHRWIKISYADILRATDGLSSANLIGSGGFGLVYKGMLDSNEVSLAVKVLNLQEKGASKSFMAECEALRNIRHRNLIKILTTCSSLDFQGNDFKALVFEYIPRGSLEKWLHPDAELQRGSRNLSFIQRLNIAIDVASALDYLHNHCERLIVHRDLKPSNILLDNDMVAKVSDFGLAKFLYDATINSSLYETNLAPIKGSFGYIPPEYGMGGNASKQGDVYSYGILVLEMFTGKRPTDDMFSTSNISLHQFAATAWPDRVMEIIDRRLVLQDREAAAAAAAAEDMVDKECRNTSRLQECLVSVIQIGVLCSAEYPRERIKMRDVVLQMYQIKDLYLSASPQRQQGRTFFSNDFRIECKYFLKKTISPLMSIDFNITSWKQIELDRSNHRNEEDFSTGVSTNATSTILSKKDKITH
ncbi:hypothetical protein ACLOJK_012455 [Asimina triloba]